jgi:hypothetical protein
MTMKRRALFAAPLGLLFGAKPASEIHYYVDAGGLRQALTANEKRISEHQKRMTQAQSGLVSRGSYEFKPGDAERLAAGLASMPWPIEAAPFAILAYLPTGPIIGARDPRA